MLDLFVTIILNQSIALFLLFGSFSIRKTLTIKKVLILSTSIAISLHLVIGIIADSISKDIPVFYKALEVILLFIFISLMFSGKWTKKTILLCLIVTLIAVSYLLFKFVLYFNLLDLNNSPSCVTKIFDNYFIPVTQLVFAISYYYLEKKLSFRRTLVFRVIEIIVIGLLLCGMLLIGSGLNTENPFLLRDYFLAFQFVILVILITVIIKNSEAIFKKYQNSRLQNQEYLLLKDYYSQVELQQDEIRKMKHDLKNQLYAVAGYIENQDSESANEQVVQLLKQLNNGKLKNFTTNPGLNALLKLKYQICLEKGICCNFCIEIPEKTNINQNDLSSLLGNVLDNAIDACSYCEEEKFINLSLLYSNQVLILSCENCYDGVHQVIETRKIDKKEHGLGLKSIRNVLEKYDGDMSYSFNSCTYKIDMSLIDSFQ